MVVLKVSWCGIIAQCSGTPECKRNWNDGKPIELLMMGFHCHSPACLGGRLTNADTGEVLCEVKPVCRSPAHTSPSPI